MKPEPLLRRGWTTGACATAAAKAAYAALLTGHFPDPVEITLPGGQNTAFTLAESALSETAAMASVVKDAGDDPDVTHGALLRVTLRIGPPGSGVSFHAGEGVGTVTRPGLAIPPGEPAINPVPRQMIRTAIAELAAQHCAPGDAIVEISIPGGEALATRTLNGRLGITGGLSILGTTGIVIPFSCSAWIHSIHRGIDVARAGGITHVAGSTGNVSETAVRALHHLPEAALLEMGDFVGGMLKYLKSHPVPRVTIAGGVAKMTKLAQGRLDLHSKRGEVDFPGLAAAAQTAGCAPEIIEPIRHANTAAQVFELASAHGTALGDAIAAQAWRVAAAVLEDSPTELEILLFDRTGTLQGRAGFAPVHMRKRLV
ncbi:cobalt-precorrin-5B (C(1))-methyltransferase [Acidocella sp.]|uniref:cobalt-precorrin-5B (C(1))-methyltransferase n=1 Tax=Acidocella sp. TaxID=50710 RepID=UPI0017DF1F4F|nr:cobalt-precorrin-5B (C(1))-methyltransferase [Acidocella sp.]NNM57586.1 cobalt-precorrin-5B (C(1))-methyltransferase [Acidocella sp.]